MLKEGSETVIWVRRVCMVDKEDNMLPTEFLLLDHMLGDF